MRRVVIVGDGTGDVAAALAELGLATVVTVAQFREMACSLPTVTDTPTRLQPAARKFGSDHPYLKKKKGRS